MNDALAPRLRFGQYKGVPLHQVPSDYLQWVSKLPDLWPAQRAFDPKAVENQDG